MPGVCLGAGSGAAEGCGDFTDGLGDFVGVGAAGVADPLRGADEGTVLLGTVLLGTVLLGTVLLGTGLIDTGGAHSGSSELWASSRS